MTAIIIVGPVLLVTKLPAKPRVVTTLGIGEISDCLRCYGDSLTSWETFNLTSNFQTVSPYLSESDFGSELSDMSLFDFV